MQAHKHVPQVHHTHQHTPAECSSQHCMCWGWWVVTGSATNETLVQCSSDLAHSQPHCYSYLVIAEIVGADQHTIVIKNALFAPVLARVPSEGGMYTTSYGDWAVVAQLSTSNNCLLLFPPAVCTHRTPHTTVLNVQPPNVVITCCVETDRKLNYNKMKSSYH